MGGAFGALLLAAACGDDNKDPSVAADASSVVATPGDASTGTTGTGTTGKTDIDGGTSTGLDGSLADGATGPTTSADGSVVESDASSLADGSTVTDAGFAPLDASVSTTDAGPCPINHPVYGCGHTVDANATWVVFDNGLEVDRVNKRAWTPLVDVVDDDALRTICTPLALGGLTGYDMPQMSDVRTLAAGCAATVPGGSCQVDQDMVYIGEAGDCTCPGGVGPNNGKFCRPEVPDCETIWDWTHTDETGFYQHWFYDVTTGSIVPEAVGVGIAVPAKGRCVRKLSDDELP